ncbi:MAG: DNA methyltransferase [Aeromonas sp.]
MSSTNGSVIAHENYPTPTASIQALLEVVKFRPGDLFLEPCKGDGAIYDLVPLPDDQKDWAEIRLDRDYLGHDFGRQFDVIITNPPFSLTEEFIRKSLNELAPDGTLIYLQRVNFLGSKKRVQFWREVGFPGKTPILIPRPRFAKGGSDSCEYCWYIWDKGGRVQLPDGMSHLISK